jgi:hypothetical protein
MGIFDAMKSLLSNDDGLSKNKTAPAADPAIDRRPLPRGSVGTQKYRQDKQIAEQGVPVDAFGNPVITFINPKNRKGFGQSDIAEGVGFDADAFWDTSVD